MTIVHSVDMINICNLRALWTITLYPVIARPNEESLQIRLTVTLIMESYD